MQDLTNDYMEYELKMVVSQDNYGRRLKQELSNAPEFYRELKEKCKENTILLFEVGMYYQTYCEDAQTLADVCGLEVTHRNYDTGYRIAGFPYNELDINLKKLIDNNYKIKIYGTEN